MGAKAALHFSHSPQRTDSKDDKLGWLASTDAKALALRDPRSFPTMLHLHQGCSSCAYLRDLSDLFSLRAFAIAMQPAPSTSQYDMLAHQSECENLTLGSRDAWWSSASQQEPCLPPGQGYSRQFCYVRCKVAISYSSTSRAERLLLISASAIFLASSPSSPLVLTLYALDLKTRSY